MSDTLALLDADTLALLDPDTLGFYPLVADVPGRVLLGTDSAGAILSGRTARVTIGAHGAAGIAATGRRGVASGYIRRATVGED